MNARLKAALAALALFVTGVLIGAAGTAWFGAQLLKRMLSSGPESTAVADFAIRRLETELTTALDLDPATQAAVRLELQRGTIEVKQARRKAMTDMSRQMRTIGVRIGQLLPAEKRPRYRELAEKCLREFGFNLEEWPAPPDLPPR